jgi:cytoskeleton protein RodZ
MMEQLPESNSAQTEKTDTAPEASAVGAILREAREKMGLSVADVANQIKFAPRQIEAIEAGDYQQLPEDAFLRGFVRSYAKILQLDAQKLLAALPNANAEPAELVIPPPVGSPMPSAHSLLQQNRVLLMAAGVLALIAGAFALWNFVSPVVQPEVAQVETPVALPPVDQAGQGSSDTEKKEAAPDMTNAGKPKVKQDATQSDTKPQAKSPVPPEQKPETKPEQKPEAKPLVKPEAKPLEMLGLTPSLQPEPAAVSPQAASPAAHAPTANSGKVSELRLEFGEESWTEIRDRDDRILSSQVNPAGSQLVVSGRAPFTMLIGHGLSARLYHDGKQVDLTPYINKYSEVAHVTLQ